MPLPPSALEAKVAQVYTSGAQGCRSPQERRVKWTKKINFILKDLTAGSSSLNSLYPILYLKQEN